MATIFSKIVKGEIPSYKIAEDDQFYAFLDINPLAKGHTLVIPKTEVDYIFDVEDDQIGKMMIFAKKVAKAIEANIPCKRIGVAVLGLEVPHAHIHLIPINSVYDIDFKQPKLKLAAEELQEIAIKIHQSFLNN
jgi:histidine triad (HIT) family protein